MSYNVLGHLGGMINSTILLKNQHTLQKVTNKLNRIQQQYKKRITNATLSGGSHSGMALVHLDKCGLWNI